ncbi:hypothetical protein A1Q2_04575 [Trichosporon asahii var. asahii CBS 8904]|uniref:Uncharacterized protein n=1 Tax=Trichosporon asahii var. asahii (strain CBS 8904) TaxID=1220162 RepID=K1VNP5_TRIAC|nr:hypothetical protein A1Q2_04575 [Trichosporon asahii var. asahii CBS 8904]
MGSDLSQNRVKPKPANRSSKRRAAPNMPAAKTTSAGSRPITAPVVKRPRQRRERDDRSITRMSSGTPDTPISLPRPYRSPSPDHHSGNSASAESNTKATNLGAEIEILRTQLRAAKAEAKTYQDENADLNYRIMEAERRAEKAETDAAAAKKRAKDAGRTLGQISKLKEAAKRRWQELEVELKLAEDEAELATKGKEEAEKLVEAYKLVLKNHGLLAGGMVGAASAGRDGASTEVTEPSYGDVEPIIHE